MSKLVERLLELRQYLDLLRRIRPRVTGEEALRLDLSLRNDVLYSLFIVAQLVIDIAGELSARRSLRFEDYTEAVRNLAAYPEFDREVLRNLERLPGFRNVLVHEYVSLDYGKVPEALDRLQAVEESSPTPSGGSWRGRRPIAGGTGSFLGPRSQHVLAPQVLVGSAAVKPAGPPPPMTVS